MSGFLSNLSARARGSLPRLQPRKPAPYEADAVAVEVPGPQIGTPIHNPQTSVDGVALPAAPVSQPEISPVRSSVAPAPTVPTAPASSLNASPAPARAARRALSDASAGPASIAKPDAVATPAAVVAPPQALSSESTHVPRDANATVPAVDTAVAPVASQDVVPGEKAVPSDADLAQPQPVTLLQDDDAQPIERRIERVHDHVEPAPQPDRLSVVSTVDTVAPVLDAEPIAHRHKTELNSNSAGKNETALTQPEPAIEVRIGSIEIVSEPAQQTEPRVAAAPPRGLSLDDYLDGAGGA